MIKWISAQRNAFSSPIRLATSLEVVIASERNLLVVYDDDNEEMAASFATQEGKWFLLNVMYPLRRTLQQSGCQTTALKKERRGLFKLYTEGFLN